MTTRFDFDSIRSLFPALSRQVNGHAAAYFDGPAGSQVPLDVTDAVCRALLHTNANRGAPFAVSRESDRLLDQAHQSLAAFVGASDADELVFGANMTTITLAVSRAVAQQWQPGDEIILSRLDHDANVTPWQLAARDRGVSVRYVDVDLSDCTLDLDSFHRQLSERTRLVAIGLASNATGTINPVREMADAAHGVGAMCYVDAVHYAPHRLIDVEQLGADFLVCSAYKFFGTHVGVLWGRRELLESIEPYKLRPSPLDLPGRWMTGTQSHEGILGAMAAVHYLGERIGAAGLPLREGLRLAFERIEAHEHELLDVLLDGLEQLPQFRVWGLTDPERRKDRVPTVSITGGGKRPQEFAELLGAEGLFCWPGNHYALPFTEAAGLEPDGTLRFGLLHYNTRDEVQRLLAALERLSA